MGVDFVPSLDGKANLSDVTAAIAAANKGSIFGIQNSVPILPFGPAGHTTSIAVPAGEQGGVGRTVRYVHRAGVACSDLRLVFTGYTQSATMPLSIPLPVRMQHKASIEYDGRTYPVTVNGLRTFTVDPGGIVISDPISITLARDEEFYVRSWTTPLDGGTTYYCSLVPSAPSFYNYTFSTARGWTQGDVVDSTGNTANGFSAQSPGHVAVLGRPLETRSRIAAIGDSITATPSSWAILAVAGAYPITTLAATGTLARDVGLPGAAPKTKQWLDGYTHAVVMLGINDVNQSNISASQVADNLALVWRRAATRGLKVWGCTITPNSTSTDAWATVGNQTPGTYEAKRLTVNAWIRAGAPLDPTALTYVAVGTPGAVVAGSATHPLRGYFETADTVESARDSGKWKAGYTSDGLHPNATPGSTALATGLNVATLVAS
jgi:lysophospholipase L1-like esterase